MNGFSLDPLLKRISERLDGQRHALAEAWVERQYASQPELARRYGPGGRAKCLEDANYHLLYLSQAILVGEPVLFRDYVEWAALMLESRGVSATDLTAQLGHLRGVLQSRQLAETNTVIAPYVDAALEGLEAAPRELPSLIEGDAPLTSMARQFLGALLQGNRHAAQELIHTAAADRVPVQTIYLQVFERVLVEIGRLWQMNRISVAQEHYCTAATQLIMSQLYPRIFNPVRSGRTMVMTCVAGELHEVGARMVADYFEMDGWNTYYLGANTPTTAIAQILLERKAVLLGISATMTYHLRAVIELIAAVRNTTGCSPIKILVGGYPFKICPTLWEKVGADGGARDAQEAIELARRTYP